MIKRLRIKFVSINMTIITIMLTIILSMVIQFTKHNLETTNLQTLEKLAANPSAPMKPSDDYEILLPYFSLSLDDQGDIMEIFTNNNYYDLSDRTYLKKLIGISENHPENTGVLQEYHLQFMRVASPTGQFFLYIDISNEIATMKHLTRNCIFIGLFSFILFLGISIFFANWAVKPVEEAWRQQKQFIADASHELKTPLTVILTNAELLQTPACQTKETLRFSENIHIMATQMRHLVEGLLELSRIDNGSSKTFMESLDFSKIIEDSLCVFEPLYYEKERILSSDITPDIRIKGIRLHLKQIIDILLDNALKYSTPGSQILVTLENHKTYCQLWVQSCGEHISQEDLKNIFKRFYRVHHTDKQQKSYGLGLSIAWNITREHRGKIWAESENNQNIFYVRLPKK